MTSDCPIGLRNLSSCSLKLLMLAVVQGIGCLVGKVMSCRLTGEENFRSGRSRVFWWKIESISTKSASVYWNATWLRLWGSFVFAHLRVSLFCEKEENNVELIGLRTCQCCIVSFAQDQQTCRNAVEDCHSLWSNQGLRRNTHSLLRVSAVCSAWSFAVHFRYMSPAQSQRSGVSHTIVTEELFPSEAAHSKFARFHLPPLSLSAMTLRVLLGIPSAGAVAGTSFEEMVAHVTSQGASWIAEVPTCFGPSCAATRR